MQQGKLPEKEGDMQPEGRKVTLTWNLKDVQQLVSQEQRDSRRKNQQGQKKWGKP